MRNVSDNFVENMKTHLCSIPFFFSRKSCRLWECGKTGRARHVTHDNILRLMRFACWV